MFIGMTIIFVLYNAFLIVLNVKNDSFTKLLPTFMSLFTLVFGGLLSILMIVVVLFVSVLDGLDGPAQGASTPLIVVLIYDILTVVDAIVLLIKTNKNKV